MTNKPENWAGMTPDEKRTFRLQNFVNSGENIEFISPEAAKAYTTKVKRLAAVYNLEKPDRVPTDINAGNLPMTMAGLDMYSAFYEPEKSFEAVMDFNNKYSEAIESFAIPSMFSGQVLDILNYKLYSWPGHGLPKNSPGWQFIEGEYMTIDEYDDFILDPTDFWLRTYLPRVFGAFEGFSMFQPFTEITENAHVFRLMPMATPQVQKMFSTFKEAGEAFKINGENLARSSKLKTSWGFPNTLGGVCKAPFDILGDTLRGTTNIMKDMFRRPEKLLQALDVIANLTIRNILRAPNIDDALVVMYPLHKGADGWMSQKQYEKFYWPSLKKVMDALINEGLIQHLFAEGSYDTRLGYINQFPRGTVQWFFDRTDMAEAKRILGNDCALMGNIPASMMVTGTPEEVKAYCKNLIEVVGRDGGFVLSPGSVVENPRLENLKALAEAANEYGYY